MTEGHNNKDQCHDTAKTTSSAHSRRDPGLSGAPLRDIVVFPHMIVPLFVGREKSIKAWKR